ncbi:TaxB [Salmonella enterica subsp. houtenae]|nr:TaxB [Salmonella enterica subsp. houtenae]
MSAHPCRIIYAVSEEDDAAKISEKLGYITNDIKEHKQEPGTINITGRIRK